MKNQLELFTRDVVLGFGRLFRGTIVLGVIYSNGVWYRFHTLFKKVAQLHCIGRETMKLLES